MSLSGCFGEDEIRNEESINDESDLIDWNVYYTATLAGLPACDEDTNGMLYFVEADNQFQVCKTTGWEIISLKGNDGKDGVDGKDGINGQDGYTNSTFTNNTNFYPQLSSNVWFYEEDFIFMDSNGSFKLAAYIEWFAKDIDGNISFLGIDYNRDNLIDIPFLQESGIFSNQNVTFNTANGAVTLNGAFSFPIDSNVEVYRNEGGLFQECSLTALSVIDIIAIDNSGAFVSNSLTLNLIHPTVMWPTSNPNSDYTWIGGWQADNVNLPIPQSDLNWVQGVGSNCFSIPQLSLNDHPDQLTSNEDNIAILTVQDPGDWSKSNLSLDDRNADSNGFTISCINEGIFREIYFETEFFGSNETNPQIGDYWVFSEIDWREKGTCDDSGPIEVIVEFEGNGQEITLEGWIN